MNKFYQKFLNKYKDSDEIPHKNIEWVHQHFYNIFGLIVIFSKPIILM